MQIHKRTVGAQRSSSLITRRTPPGQIGCIALQTSAGCGRTMSTGAFKPERALHARGLEAL